MSRVPTSKLNAALDAILTTGTTYYLSLHSADPGTTGANEFAGGGYARQPITFAAAASAIKASSNAQTVPNAGTTAATHTGVWDAVTVGNYLCGQALTSSVTAASISFPTGQVTETAA
jgi:hypothetical protein